MKYGGKQNSGGGGSFEQPPLGTQVAALVSITDIGFQADFDKSKPAKHKLALLWELSARDSKGRPFSHVEKVNLSSNEKSVMAARFAALVGRPPTLAECEEGFDDALMVGKSCLVTMARSPKNPNGKPYIGATMALPMGMPPLRISGDYSEPHRLIVWCLANQVPAPTPTPANKSAVAGTQGASRPSQGQPSEAPDTTPLPGGQSPNSDDMPF